MKIYIDCPGCSNDLEFDVESLEEDSIWNRYHLDIKLESKICNCDLREFSNYIKQQVREEFEYETQEDYDNHELLYNSMN